MYRILKSVNCVHADSRVYNLLYLNFVVYQITL